jgi:uncharacterized protein YyaL (SSP411 family)
MREMQADAGGYFSSLDADSEGEEGKYYVWQREEVQGLLGEDEYRCLSRHYGLDRPCNFEGRAWHLHTFRGVADIAAELAMEPSRVRGLIDAARAKLARARSARVRPGLDDKILAAWNALMVRGMCVAGRVFDDETLVRSAEQAMDFVRGTLFVDGRLLATARNGRAHLDAYLDDHALLVDACLALLECRWRRDDLDFAIELAEILLERFQDTDGGGFYFTAHDHEPLIHRPKPMMDDALPSGNAVAAFALGRLGHLLGEPRYLDAAEATVRASWEGLQRHPHAHTAMLDALEEQIDPPQVIVIRGDAGQARAWQRLAQRDYAPRRLVLTLPADVPDLPGLLGERPARGGITAYVCRGHRCDAPVTALRELERALAR